jgi:hypothetical protein
MDLNVWTKSTVTSAAYDESKHEWAVKVSRKGSPDRIFKPKVCHSLLFFIQYLVIMWPVHRYRNRPKWRFAHFIFSCAADCNFSIQKFTFPPSKGKRSSPGKFITRANTPAAKISGARRFAPLRQIHLDAHSDISRSL